MAKLTPAEVTDICDAARKAWNALPPNATRATFTFQGKPYVARHTGIRLLVDTPDGKPVAARYD